MPEDEVNSAGGEAEAPEAGHPESGRETLRARQRPGPPPPSELAGHFPQLDILEVLGEGGMGYVYKARQKGLDRLVALKLLPQDISTDQNFAERFAREARALARLNHASIVTVYDSGQIGNLYYFVMEYVDGLNLRELLNRGDGRVETDQALRIVGSVCDALEYAHEEGVVHRDIKPENILLDTKGRIKIADFGLAKLLGGGDDRQSSLTMGSPHQMLGTPHYMAPEQTERPLEVDHRADIYAIGVVFYEMLTGELPLGRFPLPSEMGRGDAVLDDIVVKALEKRPERRFQRASDVKLAVDSALSGVGPAPEPAGPDRVVTPPVEPVPAPGAGTTYPSGRYRRFDLDTAFGKVRWPSYAMIAAGVLTVLGLSPAGIVMIIGGMWMRQLRARGMALAAGIVAVLPLSAFWFPVTMAAGAWVLYVVNRREIVAAFEAVASARRQRR